MKKLLYFKNRFLINIIKNHYNLIFGFSIIVFNILYLIYGSFFHNVYQETDGFTYYIYFQDILKNNIPPEHSEYWPFGIPILIGILSFFTGDFFIAGKILIVEFSILFLISIYYLILKIFNEKIALITSLFIATNYWAVNMFFVLGTDVPFAALILLSISFLMENTVKSKKKLYYSSLFLGFATLIRWTGLFFIPIIILKIVLDGLFMPEQKKMDKYVHNIENPKSNSKDINGSFYKYSLKTKIQIILYNLISFIGIYFIVIIPLLFITTIWYGSPFYNNNIENVYKAMQLYQGVPWDFIQTPESLSWLDLFFGSESSLFYQQLFHSFLFEYPKAFSEFLLDYNIYPLTLLFKNNILHLLFSYFLLFLVFFGYIIRFQKDKKYDQKNKVSKTIFILSILVAYLLIISMGFNRMRFLLPIIPLLIAPILYVIFNILKLFFSLMRNFLFRIKKIIKNLPEIFTERKNLIYIYLMISPIIIFQFSYSYSNVENYKENEWIEFKIAGKFLSEEMNPEDVFVARKMNYLYYIGFGTFRNLPKTKNVSEFLIELQSADYLIISERIEIVFRPDLRFLLNPLDPFLQQYLHNIFNYSKVGRRIVIYQII